MTRDDERLAREVQCALDGAAREVRVTDGWIDVELDPVWPLPSDGWDALARNAAFAPGVKLCVDGAGTTCLRAEVAPPAPARPLAALRDAAVAAVRGDEPAAECRGASAEDVQEAFDASGWPWRARGAGAWAVRLDVPGHYREAEWRTKSNRSTAPVRLVLDAAPRGATGRRAVAAALLRATAECRLVRAIVMDGRPALEVALAPAPGSHDLDHACAALSVAARGVAQAAELLAGDPDLARAYLAALGDTASLSDDHPTAHRNAGAGTVEEIGDE